MPYFDNSATTVCSHLAAKYAYDTLQNNFGNPSSLHEMGLNAEKIIINAKTKLANAIGATKDEIFFTSGGTESNNLAIFGVCEKARNFGRIISSSAEHDSIITPLKKLAQKGFDVVFLDPDQNGIISMEKIKNSLTANTILISLMLINNETGARQEIEKIKPLLIANNSPAIIHCDAVAAFGKTAISVSELSADIISLSGHKIHAPKGVGAVYIKKGTKVSSQILGGAQQKGIRAGTEPTTAIAGLYGAMCDMNINVDSDYVCSLKSRFIAGLCEIDNVIINGENDFPYIVNFSLIGYKSEVILNFLSLKNIYVSSGSACTGGKNSHVLTAMGISPKIIDSGVRVSFSRYNTIDEVDILLSALKQACISLHKSR